MPRSDQTRRPAPGDTVLDDAVAIRAVASPLRHAIVQVVVARGEASVSEIAGDLQRPAPTLYRHIDRLLDAGVLREEGTRSTGKRDARVFSSGEVWFRYSPRSPAKLEALVAFVRAMSRNALREIVGVLEGRRAEVSGETRDTHFFTEFGWFDDEELAELNRRVDAVAAMFKNKSRAGGKRQVSVTLMEHPTRGAAGAATGSPRRTR